MSLQDTIAADVQNVFLNTNDFAVSIAYTPQGGSVRTIYAQISEVMDPEFETATADLDFNLREMTISAVDNTNGVVSPTVCGRGGNAGDSFTIGGGSTTWYPRKILEDGRPAASGGSGSGMHRILVADSKVAFPNG